jgi:hypothetical protein
MMIAPARKKPVAGGAKPTAENVQGSNAA